MMNDDDSLSNYAVDKIIAHLKESESVLFITGAGISAESGLPTYRGIGGLYDGKLTEHNLPIETILSGQMLHEKPQLVWQYLGEIEKACRGKTFNMAHEIIAKFEQQFSRVVTLTQNVDGFHLDAGSNDVIEIHGNYRHLECMGCGEETVVADYTHLNFPPYCERCQALIRPQVVLFGEQLPVDSLRRLEEELQRGFDVIFSIGTTSVFPYISAPIYQKGHALTIEINLDETEVSDAVDYKLKSSATDALKCIWRKIVK